MEFLNKIIRNPKYFQKYLGINPLEYSKILENFEIACENQRIETKNKLNKQNRGKKPSKSYEYILQFLFFYVKIYPTCEFASILFGIDSANINRWYKKYLPILEKTMECSFIKPEEKTTSMDDMFKKYPTTRILIDATERRTERKKDNIKQKEDYSGKKKCHTRKLTIACDEKGKILSKTKFVGGRTHDKIHLEESQIILDLPPWFEILADSGYQGIDKMTFAKTFIPFKKPKGGILHPKEKEYNKNLSSIRVKVEHAFAGIKKFRSIKDTYRNKNDIENTFSSIVINIYNSNLNYKT